jgi:hypothetical protein
MAAFFCLLGKKTLWCAQRRVRVRRGFGHERKKKRATNFELFDHLLPFFFYFCLKREMPA